MSKKARASADEAPTPMGTVTRVIGRIPILDVQPVLECGRRPVKAVAGETFEVSATIFREGHEMLGAGVVLRTPDGGRQPLVGMTEVVPGTDRYAAQVTPGGEGRWRFQVEAWGDPIAHWRHDAAIKVPRGLDVGLMMTEGAILFERAARSIRPDRPNGHNGTNGSRGPNGTNGPGRAVAGTAAASAGPTGPQGARWA